MTEPYRSVTGGRVDRSRRLQFSFDGRTYSGFAGDTLASALIANGVHLTGRSFKYHRPRGILTAGSEEPNALVGIGSDEQRYTPNLRATQVELYDGLVAQSQNRWPSLSFDLAAANNYFGWILSAGFYYKTFMWPASFWRKLYEPLIRRAAGLGRAPREADADRYTQVYAHCDVLVVGSGPAGLSAALAAAASGAKVLLCDEQAELGGSLLSDNSSRIDALPATDWLNATLSELAARPNVVMMPRTTAFGWYPHNFLGLCERVTDHLTAPDPKLPRERLWQVRAKEVVLATGAIERPMVFPNNDRPGVMMAEAARTYTNRYGVRPGDRVVVFTACDSAYRAAIDLKAAGATIAAVVDIRTAPTGPWISRALSEGIRMRHASCVADVRGRLRVNEVVVANASDFRTDREVIRCDLLLMSGGFTPSIHLFSQSRGKLVFDEGLQAYLPGEPVERVRSVGACRGNFDLDDALRDGFAAGMGAATDAGAGAVQTRQFGVEAVGVGKDGFVGALPRVGDRTKARAWVDFQNDVTSKDIELATREGFRSIEHVKRYTTVGMATDQGKLSNMNSLGIVSQLLDVVIPKIGLTTFRPPYTPTTFGVFAGQSRGELFDPVRKTPIHDWAEANGAVFEDVGLWKRAHFFPRGGEAMHDAVKRECRAVRRSVGIFDASTLGKIEVVGSDAAEFLNRIYINSWTGLKPGRLRYGVMLGENGFIMDDGVVARMSADCFHVTTTTGGAARVLSVMEDYLQTEWPELDVWLTSTTEQWAVIAVQGPDSRKVLEPLVPGIDLSREAMPHMSVREGYICGVPTRLFRVSFTGELGFEVNVPAGHGRAVWEAIAAEGRAYGLIPYGTEAMHVLRAEKGFIIVGQETDGTVTPDDAGLGWAIGKNKQDFVGKRSLSRPAMTSRDRKQLVGLLAVEPGTMLEEGAQIVESPASTCMIGHVTSSYFSTTLNRPIALALVRGGRSKIGTRLSVPMLGRTVAVDVVQPVFHDPKGSDSMRDSPMRRLNSLAKLSERTESVPGAALEVLPDATKLVFRGRSAAISAAGAAFGVSLPDVACRFATKGNRSAYWLGPDEWMLEAGDEQSNELLAQLRTHLEGQSCSLVDVTHRSDAFSVTGERSEYVLNHGCPLDLSERAFPVGTCTRTLLWKAGIVLSRGNSASFRVDVWRSFAPYVWSMLDEARRELA